MIVFGNPKSTQTQHTNKGIKGNSWFWWKVLKSPNYRIILGGSLWAHTKFSVAFAAIDSLRKSRKPLGEQIEERLRERGLLWSWRLFREGCETFFYPLVIPLVAFCWNNCSKRCYASISYRKPNQCIKCILQTVPNYTFAKQRQTKDRIPGTKKQYMIYFWQAVDSRISHFE